MCLIGNGEGHTLLILTGEELRLLREWLTHRAMSDDPMGTENHASGRCLAAFNAGIARGTAKLQQEFKDEQQRKKGKL